MTDFVIISAIIGLIRYNLRYNCSLENQVRPFVYINLSTLKAFSISPNNLNCCSRVLACGSTSLTYS